MFDLNLSVSKNRFTFSKGVNFQSQKLTFFDFNFNVKKIWYLDLIKMGGNVTFGGGVSNFEQFTFKMGINKKLIDIISFNINSEYRRKVIINDIYNIEKFNNYQITANIGYIFN